MGLIWVSALAGIVLVLVAFREATKFQRRQGGRAAQSRRLVEQLTDPREAAAILLVQTALYGDGRITVDQKVRICALMSEHFGSDEDEAEGLFSFGRMAIGQTGDALESLGRILRPVRERLTLEEMKELVGMMSAVAATHDRADLQARRLIDETRHALHVDVPAALRD